MLNRGWSPEEERKSLEDEINYLEEEINLSRSARGMGEVYRRLSLKKRILDVYEEEAREQEPLEVTLEQREKALREIASSLKFAQQYEMSLRKEIYDAETT